MSEHYHCPFECEHPQPFTLADPYPTDKVLPEGMRAGGTYCGRCWFKENMASEMVLCAPPLCE